ncbi:MAG: aldose epimerase family protein [Verrucomicrobiota bacterium]
MNKVLQNCTFAIALLVTSRGALVAQETSQRTWGNLQGGEKIVIFTLKNKNGMEVEVAEYGAILNAIRLPEEGGSKRNVLVSYRGLEEALAGGVKGSVIGRFANRIDNGGFEIDGTFYKLESVNPKTKVHIHGGKTGFHRQKWKGEARPAEDSASVKLSLVSKDGHEGYPGEVLLSATYTLDNENRLTIDYEGMTNQPTHLNLTNHAYFNLAGDGDITGHDLTLATKKRLEFDERKIPNGKILDTAGTIFDFSRPTRLGERLPLLEGGGYDHCFVISLQEPPGKALTEFATLTDPESATSMTVSTNKPGVQIYTANHFKGNPAPKWGGICFETQFFPDTPNQSSFPSSLLDPGEAYLFTTTFEFDWPDS